MQLQAFNSKQWAAGASQKQITQMYVNALDNPHVLILGHLGRSGLDLMFPHLSESVVIAVSSSR